MNTTLAALIVCASFLAAVLVGKRLRRLLPEDHLSADTRDTVKLAMGLVATMTALLLGLLISSAKGSYDTTRSQVIQLAANVAFLDRVLSLYGPEAVETRAQLHTVVEEAVGRLWPADASKPSQLSPDVAAGDAFYIAMQQLSPQNDMQRSLKGQAASLASEMGQLRTLLIAQSAPSISRPLLIVVVIWVALIFLSFSMLAPPNATANFALLASASSVVIAIFLILELARPFGGVLQISSEPMLNALSQLKK